MKPAIPARNRDLRQYVLRRRAAKLAAYLLWMLVFLFSALAYNRAHQTYRPERLLLGWRLAVWLAAGAVVGFFIFRIGRLLRDRTFEGVIEKSGLSHTYASSADPGVGSPVNYDFRLHTYLIVRTGSGKRRRVRFEQKQGFYLYYYEGTYLCHFAGLPYPICDPSRRIQPKRQPAESRRAEGTESPFDDLSGGILCAACGCMNQSLSAPCGRCGHSLINPADLWNGNN